MGAVFVICFYDDRRLLVFYALTAMLIEGHNRFQLQISVRKLLAGCVACLAIVVSVIAMSIERGVGEFNSTSPVESFRFVGEYLRSDWAAAMLLHNFEGPSSMFHTYDAIGYMMDEQDFAYGSTYLKVLFLLVPRDAYPEKPNSLVHEYTDRFYPSYRAEGGSWVPNIFAEAYWNFGFVGGLGFLLGFLWILDRWYRRNVGAMLHERSLADVFFLSCYFYLLFLFRGSGIDLFAFHALVYFLLATGYGFVATLRARRPAARAAA